MSLDNPPDYPTLSNALKLFQDVQEISVRNYKGQVIVPYPRLKALMTMQRVEDVITESATIEDFEQHQIAQDVCTSGIRTFAALICMGKPELFRKFRLLESSASEGSPDSRLPLTVDELDKTFHDPAQSAADKKRKAKVFFDLQFTFWFPVFPQRIPHREFSDQVRLPFLKTMHVPGAEEDGALNGGHFGVMSRVKLLPLSTGEHHQEEGQGNSFVLKQLKVKGGDAYKQELRCLALLNSVHHPCVVELCGSFTQQNIHSFLFREATRGNLKELFARTSRPPEFQKDEAFFLAICGLTSALSLLHYYSNDELQLKLLGCHHDLKPGNILVDGSRFILADFGLSQMSASDRDLQGHGPERDRYFQSPEQFDYASFAHQDTGPARDIWSLGCILAVLFAYMKGGPQEVLNFREQRTYMALRRDKPIQTVLKSFHRAGQEHPAVSKWLAGENWHPDSPKANEFTPVDNDLIELIKNMLLIDPSKRPSVQTVLRQLRCLTLRVVAEPVGSLGALLACGLPIEYEVERQVFLEWLRRIESSANEVQPFLSTDAIFDRVHQVVCEIQELFLSLTKTRPHERPHFARLRQLNEELLSCMESSLQSDVRFHAELSVLPSALSHDDASADVTGNADSQRFLLLTANVRHLMKNSGSGVERIDPERVYLAITPDEASQMRASEINGIVRTFEVGTLQEDQVTGGPPLSTPIIVEELDILRDDYNNPGKSKQLIAALDQILGLNPQQAAEMRALSCAGIYHKEAQRKIGIVYRYPAMEGTLNEPPRVESLVELFKRCSQSVSYEGEYSFLSVDDRLELATNLAATVYKFHAAGWLHKEISSYNILCFGAKYRNEDINSASDEGNNMELPQRLWLGQQALIGFSHGRPDDAGYSNKMHVSDLDLFIYRYPGYKGADTSERFATAYQPEYDYYSLGVVLLEIGLWASAKDMLELAMDVHEGRQLPNAEQASAILLRRYVPLLEGTMGQAYAAAVKVCLSGALVEKVGPPSGGPTVDDRFNRMVLQRLRRLCSVRMPS